MSELDKKNVNCVFIGHVDAGKSTLCGNLLCLTGQVNARDLSKYKSEAIELNRESWYLAFLMDLNEDERAKGKTVDVGRAYFSTKNRRYTILDAPGHKNYVPNMINGVAQADIGILIVSARKGEFEAGFHRQGQTREHVLLAKSLGVTRLIVAINKVDDPSVDFSQERYNSIVKQLKPFICKLCGYRINKGTVTFLPISGLNGLNVIEPINQKICPWYKGPSLLEALDNIQLDRDQDTGTLRLPIYSKDNSNGFTITGKVERGILRVGQSITISPTNTTTIVKEIYIDNDKEKLDQIEEANCGENVKIKLGKEISSSDIYKGFVISTNEDICPSGSMFIARLQILDDSDVISCGYESTLHIHTLSEDCKIEKIYDYDIENYKIKKKLLKFTGTNTVVGAKITCNQKISLEKYDQFNKFGQFVLRNDKGTVAIGRVIMLPKN
jgi:peptide chain release factor subunit 3